MRIKRIVQRLIVVSVLVAILIMVQAGATIDRGAHVDEHWFRMIISNDEYLTALLTHDIDMGGPPTDESVGLLADAGFTMTSTTRLGYTFLMTNNRVWPFGTANGKPDDPEYDRTMNFRKGVGYLVPKSECVALYGVLMSACEWWLPPGSAYWINPDAPAPTFDPMLGVSYLDAGGFVQGTTPNPDYDSSLPWSAEYLRIDPVMGGDVTFEYYAIGPTEAPIGFEMAQIITSYYHTAGLDVDLVAGTWLGMVSRLVNDVLDDYQMMTGIGIVWGSPAPDILYDFTYHENLPLWNFVGMNISELNEAGETMMSTLDLAECRQAAFDIQTYLSQYSPYMPMLLWNMFTAASGPYDTQPGVMGIINFKGRGAMASNNVWGKMLTHADRCDPYRPDVEINQWGLGAYLDTLNPMTADTTSDWQVLENVMEGLYRRSPFSLDYLWWGATEEPVIEPWIGPGRSQIGGNEVYDAEYTGTHYNGEPIETVTAEDMIGDDQLGMVTTWTLRPGMYWHGSDPGPDMLWDTGDDGVKYPVTAEDLRFGWDLCKYQDNVRYFSSWWHVHGVEVLDTYTVKIYEERRYLFAFEGHDIGLLTPKHIWEPWINPTIDVNAMEFTRPDGTTGYGNIWTGYTNHHAFWFGWEEPYMEDPIYPGQTLTKLIGFGPFIYHLGGWEPGVSAHFESNKAYFARAKCPTDLDFDLKVEADDWHVTMATEGPFGAYGWGEIYRLQLMADICPPAQIITLDEVYAVQYFWFGYYWGPDPVPPGFTGYPN